jgi:threonine dehydratase
MYFWPKERSMIDFKAAVGKAERAIRSYLPETPLVSSPVLSDLTGASVYLKLENLQATGSFKARGSLNRMLSLTEEEKSRGVVTASTGNHGAGVANAGQRLSIKTLIFVHETASPAKIENIRRFGGEIRYFGVEPGATELHARAYADSHGMPFISAYNDPLVIAGQGTIGAEVARQLPEAQVILTAVGGGGLIAGVAGFLKAVNPKLTAIGASAKNSMAMAASVRAGRIVETEHLPTLSDGTSGGLEPGTVTFELCKALVDDWVDVSEEEIRSALRLFIESQHMLCEGAAAAAVAALVRAKERVRGKTAVVVISGANISADRLKEAL